MGVRLHYGDLVAHQTSDGSRRWTGYIGLGLNWMKRESGESEKEKSLGYDHVGHLMVYLERQESGGIQKRDSNGQRHQAEDCYPPNRMRKATGRKESRNPKDLGELLGVM